MGKNLRRGDRITFYYEFDKVHSFKEIIPNYVRGTENVIADCGASALDSQTHFPNSNETHKLCRGCFPNG